MSFTKLKSERDAHAGPSYVASDAPETRRRAAEESEGAQNASSSSVQTEDLYKIIPSTLLEIRTDAKKGRGLWAKRNIGAGQTILALPPYSAALSSDKLPFHCSFCSTPGLASASLKRCTQCQIVYYCDSTCQSADWTSHKLECAALRRCSPSSSEGAAIPNDAIRCLARMMWRRKKKGLASDWAKEIDAMQAHPPNSPSAQEQQTHLALSLVRFLGLSSPQELAEFGVNSGAELAQVVARFTTNTFTLSAPDLTPLGACVAPPVALINHACQPNAVVVFPGGNSGKEPLMHVVTIREVQAGEEILTAYIDTTLPRTQRRQALKETYSFDCACILCEGQSKQMDPRESVWCVKRCGGMCPMPTEDNPLSQCSTCGAVLRDTDAVLDAARVGQQGLDKAQALQFSDRAKAQQLTTNLTPILASAGLTPATHPLLGLRRLHLDMLIEDLSQLDSSGSDSAAAAQKILDEAVVTATHVCAGLDSILSYGHPVRALARAELGKLLAVDEPEPLTPPPPPAQSSSSSLPSPPPASLRYPPSGPARLRLALETLLLARDELWIGFGMANEGGDIGRSIRDDIVSLERELGVWKRGVSDAIKDAREARAGK
ncbi:hypothetical protein C8F01DRAFT_1260703 [Mycena amicta]|nr:hypothetical protein C8F01DRAFT_1260703 [Mycena amicta]